ncbi:CTP-dependent riboflavin kinase [Halorientalis marina]|jgi:riboflavin kinase|uniref:CTP-dependent riboflavin kinase n=1 Tax=Halorientalis marina TaxID=2931976 RepID=UPI001FF1BEF4|nr:CTP-dependent riboflavin kinase [Halorientalis marina]
MAQTTGRTVGHDELATLKLLALEGAIEGQQKVSCSALAADLDASNQTASRRLQGLDDEGYVEREIVSDGQWVEITPAGESALRREYADYRRVFERDASIELAGFVTSGMGEGRHYISLPGYMEQFIDKLGYEPFAGTLNVDLTAESVRARAGVAALEPVQIEGWEDDERTYGPAYCYPATVASGDSIYEPAHVITPERTHHDEDQLEVIAPDKLRDELGLEDGDEVTVDVTER